MLNGSCIRLSIACFPRKRILEYSMQWNKIHLKYLINHIIL